MISAGDIPLSGSGVLRNFKMAYVNAPVSVSPVEDILSARSRFMDRKAASARSLDRELYADER